MLTNHVFLFMLGFAIHQGKWVESGIDTEIEERV